jgi:hypothetical protein
MCMAAVILIGNYQTRRKWAVGERWSAVADAISGSASMCLSQIGGTRLSSLYYGIIFPRQGLTRAVRLHPNKESGKDFDGG